MNFEEDFLNDYQWLEEYNDFNARNPDYRLVYNVRERRNHLSEWDDEDFFKRFRLTKPSVAYLLHKIEPSLLHRTERNHALTPMQQLLIALRFYATGNFYVSVGDFGGIHKSTAGAIVKRVSTSIASLGREFIKFPNTQESIQRLQTQFYEIARFPRVVGAIDCSHIRIMSPGGDNAEIFRNRKGYFSLNVQAVCDKNLNFLDIVTRWPGSSHDSNIFENSACKAKFENGLLHNGLLLGDSGYPLRNYLITPITNPDTPSEITFNEAQIRTRNVIERCFGVWKRRFPVLSVGMRCRLPLAQDIIVSTAVLQNIAHIHNEPEHQFIPEEDNYIEEAVIPFHNFGNDDSARRQLVDYFSVL